MGHIFTILELDSYYMVADELKMFTCNREVIKELGEPIIIENGQRWILCMSDNECVGFIGYNDTSILYAYVVKYYRGEGLFNLMYKNLPIQDWLTIASNMSLPIFIKKGFTVIKNYKTCHKLKLVI